MKTKTAFLFISVIIFLSFLTGAMIYPKMPELIASHWNAAGTADGYTGKFWGIFLLPFLMTGMSLLLYFLPKIDPFSKNIEAFRVYYNIFWIYITLFLFYIFFLSILWNLGFRFNFTILIIPAMSVLFYLMGSILGKSRRNWFFGIRTPWTLSSDEVWRKTHLLGGKLFKASAVFSLFGLFFRSEVSLIFVIVPVLTASLTATVYSYFEYRKMNLRK
jgi:uncharacterized membrane protein